MNPYLKDPVNTIGTVLAIIGGICMLGILFSFPDWIAVSGIVLWVIGIILLIIRSAGKK